MHGSQQILKFLIQVFRRLNTAHLLVMFRQMPPENYKNCALIRRVVNKYF